MSWSSVIERAGRRYEPEPNSGCWLWLGGTNGVGYGQLSAGPNGPGRWRKVLAHRVLYEYYRGPIPVGLEIDHLCRQPSCVNPWHLEAVTKSVNQRRGRAPAVARRRWTERTACAHGHPYDDANTRWKTTEHGVPYRICRACAREYGRRYDRERRSA